MPDKPESADLAVDDEPYVLEQQAGHLLRRAHQRHTAIFSARMGGYQLTPTQFAALAKISDHGAVSQNRLGRLTAMDPATMQGVIGRLLTRGLVRRDPDPDDRRRMLLRLTADGEAVIGASTGLGKAITEETLAPLSPAEQAALLRLLAKIT